MPRCPVCSLNTPEGSRFCPGCAAPLAPWDAAPSTNPCQPTDEKPKLSPFPLAHEQARFLPGQVLAGRYRIVAALGKGGMGEVYRADDLTLGQSVALKFLPASRIADSGGLARLRNEVRIARQVSHPNVCRVYDIGEYAGQPFLTMEYIDGQDLAGLLKQVGRMPEERGIELARQMCLGLAAVHDQGVLHRDLKPHNVMIDGRGQARISDFGLAIATDQKEGKDEIAGTAAYMAPEQLAGKGVSIQSDLFSLGLVLYELITGKRPFAGKTLEELRRWHKEATPTKPSSHVNGLNPAVEAVIVRCLEKNPHDRPRSAYEVLAGLPGGDPLAAPHGKPRHRRHRKAVDSLAVLPLFNASADPDLEYLSDGITESIIRTLSQLPKLRVMARSTVFRFKGRDVDSCAVGRELNVRAVLTGRLLQRGDRLIIRAELVDTADGAQLWGGQYDRELAEIFATEEAIAQEITAGLRLRLTGEQRKRLGRRHTENTEAYQLYLKGLYHWNKRTEEGLKKAVQCLEEALAIDPTYALAYAGLADCYNVPHFGALSNREAGPPAKAAALRALEIDENLAEAHAALAFAKFEFDWDWAGAESGFQRAIELNPNYARAHHGYSSYLLALGRFDEAFAEIKRAEELDPLSLIISLFGGFVLHCARRYDQAIEQFHRTLELDPRFAWAHYMLGLAYAGKEMYAEAVAAVERASRLDEGPVVLAGLGYTLAKSGQREKALKLLDQLQELSKGRPVAAYDIATVYAGLDDKEQAFAWLEKAYQDRGLWLPLLRVDPALDSLHTDSRFAELLRRMNFPP